ncbi:alpha-amylase family glycosyl hydrolase [uncultured Marinococcus sp.]|uniref:alpha-amylase family glycosyl hydrolase n=1 Tax=uncultured Marinococcus sp. TaxID=487012 RepID=UPI00261AE8E9|nr:alpha-amylase family glycosyl hydrolase [uncultured Marinococcus sp.]
MPLNAHQKQEVEAKLKLIYDEKNSAYLLAELLKVVDRYKNLVPSFEKKEAFVSEKDTVLITYGDSVREKGKAPLQTLHEFLNDHIKHTLNGVHILPFYPYSSDDGFSVIDYFQVDPELGEWKDIENMATDYDLMFDAVINHISAGSNWFQGYLKGEPAYKNYFIEADPEADYSKVTRPRALPLLTKFETAQGSKHIWTTFSEDQVDLNYKNPDVVAKIIELLLFYISKGAKMIRLDAIGFLWKEMGTTSIHLDQTHKMIQVFRIIIEAIAPEVILITETNVPHKDNISYFGSGYNEAGMVYQFPLPPLTLHAFLTGNAKHLSEWAGSLEETTEETTFFNFLASHDGIGVRPVEGILANEEVEKMIETVYEHGGKVSYKDNGNGMKSPYELNINYLDALSHPKDEQELKVARFLAAQSVLLSMAGVPGIYIHSLFGSRNYHQGVEETERFRTINREKMDRQMLEEELNDPGSLRHKVFSKFKQLIAIRTNEKAFHPNSAQQVLFLNNQVFSLVRTDKHNSEEQVTVLVNVSNEEQEVAIDVRNNQKTMRDLISGQQLEVRDKKVNTTLKPYAAAWLK